MFSSVIFGNGCLTFLKGSEYMTTNMLLATIAMSLGIVIANADSYPILQIWLAGIIYAIIITMIVMEFLM